MKTAEFATVVSVLTYFSVLHNNVLVRHGKEYPKEIALWTSSCDDICGICSAEWLEI